MKLEKISELVGGKLQGDGSLEISGVCAFEQAEVGHITFAIQKKLFDILGLSNYRCEPVPLGKIKFLVVLAKTNHQLINESCFPNMVSMGQADNAGSKNSCRNQEVSSHFSAGNPPPFNNNRTWPNKDEQ